MCKQFCFKTWLHGSWDLGDSWEDLDPAMKKRDFRKSPYGLFSSSCQIPRLFWRGYLAQLLSEKPDAFLESTPGVWKSSCTSWKDRSCSTKQTCQNSLMINNTCWDSIQTFYSMDPGEMLFHLLFPFGPVVTPKAQNSPKHLHFLLPTGATSRKGLPLYASVLCPLPPPFTWMQGWMPGAMLWHQFLG